MNGAAKASNPSVSWRRFRRYVHAVVAYESSVGRAAEVAGWANALVAAAFAGGVFGGTRSVGVAAAVGVTAFVALRLALAHRIGVWVVWGVGTAAVGGSAGALGWLLAQVAERAWCPPVAAVLCGLAAAAVPAWAYTVIARARAAGMPDSLVHPPSVRPSCPP